MLESEANEEDSKSQQIGLNYISLVLRPKWYLDSSLVTASFLP